MIVFTGFIFVALATSYGDVLPMLHRVGTRQVYGFSDILKVLLCRDPCSENRRNWYVNQMKTFIGIMSILQIFIFIIEVHLRFLS